MNTIWAEPTLKRTYKGTTRSSRLALDSPNPSTPSPRDSGTPIELGSDTTQSRGLPELYANDLLASSDDTELEEAARHAAREMLREFRLHHDSDDEELHVALSNLYKDIVEANLPPCIDPNLLKQSAKAREETEEYLADRENFATILARPTELLALLTGIAADDPVDGAADEWRDAAVCLGPSSSEIQLADALGAFAVGMQSLDGQSDSRRRGPHN